MGQGEPEDALAFAVSLFSCVQARPISLEDQPLDLGRLLIPA